mmetsp:Transcript_45850/g.121624  ORF Transcript_45850/g.121624 Transcript_45850/m.121624 type:complete len:329 (-) Transcript_45850:1318-2304(-)
MVELDLLDSLLPQALELIRLLLGGFLPELGKEVDRSQYPWLKACHVFLQFLHLCTQECLKFWINLTTEPINLGASHGHCISGILDDGLRLISQHEHVRCDHGDTFSRETQGLCFQQFHRLLGDAHLLSDDVDTRLQGCLGFGQFFLLCLACGTFLDVTHLLPGKTNGNLDPLQLLHLHTCSAIFDEDFADGVQGILWNVEIVFSFGVVHDLSPTQKSIAVLVIPSENHIGRLRLLSSLSAFYRPGSRKIRSRDCDLGLPRAVVDPRQQSCQIRALFRWLRTLQQPGFLQLTPVFQDVIRTSLRLLSGFDRDYLNGLRRRLDALHADVI